MTEKSKNLKRKVFSTKRKQKQLATMEFDAEKLKADILKEARALKLDLKAMDVMAERIVAKTTKWVEKRVTLLESDLNRHVADELERYNEDLAYVYRNRGKII